uniref:Uncharacterized protein n=1 Tax=viral metagenome TaxID=1070528 RepID=A0A6C0M0S2_9ZZZZ
MVRNQKNKSDDVVDDNIFAELGLGPDGDENADDIYLGQHGGKLFEVIRNPETGRNVSIYGKIGQGILRNYVVQLGGHIRSGSIIPSPEPYDMKGGVSVRKTGPKSFKSSQKKVIKMVKKGKTVHPSKLKKSGVKVATKGGAIRSGSILPSPEPFNMSSQTGGHKGPCGVNPKSGRCHKSSKWDKQNCVLKNGRCSPTDAKKSGSKKVSAKKKASPKKSSSKKASPKKSSSKKASPKKSSSKKASPKKSSSENKQQSVVKPKIYGNEWGALPTDEELGFYDDDERDMGYDERDYAEMARIDQEFREQELIEEYGSLEAAQEAYEAHEENRIDQANYPYTTPDIPLPSFSPKPEKVSKKVSTKSAKKSAKKSTKTTKSSKACKMYKTKKDGSRRLSARCYYDTHGSSSVGDKCDGAWGGKPGCLRLSGKKGSPKFLKCNDSDSQSPCKE